MSQTRCHLALSERKGGPHCGPPFLKHDKRRDFPVIPWGSSSGRLGESSDGLGKSSEAIYDGTESTRSGLAALPPSNPTRAPSVILKAVEHISEKILWASVSLLPATRATTPEDIIEKMRMMRTAHRRNLNVGFETTVGRSSALVFLFAMAIKPLG